MPPPPSPAPPSRGSDPGPGRWTRLAPILGLVLLGLFAYGNSLHGEFAFDDREHVRDNLAIRDLGTFLSPRGYALYPNRYVAYVTFALNYRLGGADPFGYHVVNLLIHLAAALLVYRLVQLAFRTPLVRDSRLAPDARVVAFLAAALFVTHPLGTQAVSYVVQRLASLGALLYLATVVLYLSWRLAGSRPAAGKGRRAALYAGTILAALLAVRTKEVAFTLPLALGLVELLFFPPGGVRRWLPVVPVGLVALLIPASWVDLRGPVTAVVASADRVTRLQTTIPRLDYLRTQFAVICEYLRLLAWPSGQNLDHDFPVYTSWLAPRVLGSIALLGALAAFAVWSARRSAPRTGSVPLDPAFRLVSFGIGWFFVTLLVESSVIPIVDVIYEHRAYLPSVGIFASVATLLGLWLRRITPGASARVTVLVGVALALVLGSLTLQRNAVWADPVSLWSDAAAKSPGKFRPHQNLGESYEAIRRYADAEHAFRRAVEIDPASATARTSLATVLQRSGRAGEAEAEYREALRIAPDHLPALFNLAEILWRSGRRDEAAALYRRFLDLGPRSGPARAIAESRAGVTANPPGAGPTPPP